MSNRYSKLTTSQAKMLAAIPFSEDGFGLKYYPCSVQLKSGAICESVYFCEAQRWFETWGVWPEDDRYKVSIDVDDVVSISESLHRLPPKFANDLYAAGESGMGYTVFTVEFQDGSRAAYQTGNAVDCIVYPPGQNAKTVGKVIPHLGRDDPHRRSCPPYIWCLYTEA